MARAMRFLVALLVLVGLTWAGKGNGGGKPGGGGGGGGDPSLTGLFYVFLEGEAPARRGLWRAG